MKKIKILLLSFVAAVTAVSAQTKPDYNQVINILVADCPELRSLIEAEKASLETKAAANTLDNPTAEGQRVWGREGTKNDLGISQEFSWPGVYRARSRAIKAATRASDFLQLSAFSDKLLEVEQLVIDIIYQKKAIQLERSILDHMKELEKNNIEGYNHGELTLLDLKRIEIERIAAASSLREATRTLDELYSSLEAATSRTDCRTLLADINEIPSQSILPEADYEQLIDNADPHLAWLRANGEAIRLEGKAETLAARTPGLSLGYAFVRELGDNFHGLSASITLPVYSRRHTIASAKASAIAADIDLSTSRMKTIAAMRAMRTSAISMQTDLADYDKVFGDDDYAHLLDIARQGGELTNLQYLQELNYFLGAARTRLDLRRELTRTLAALNRYNSLPQ